MDGIDQLIRESSPDKAIEILKNKTVDVRDWGESVKEYDPQQHDILGRRPVNVVNLG